MLLRQLQTFREAARLGNFSDAARKLHLTQSAVTHQVKALEQFMGIKLYERHRRGIVLTDQGGEVLAHAEKILALVRDMDECVHAMRGGFLGNISVAAHRGVVKYKLPAVVKLFRKTYPTMGVILSTRLVDDEIISMVGSGTVDFGVVTSWSDHGDLEYHEFLSYDMFLCVQPGHPIAKGKKGKAKPTLEELAEEPLLLYEPIAAIRKHIDRTFEGKGLSCNPVVETGGAMILREYAKGGLGAAIVSGISIEAEPDPELKAVSVTHLFGKLGYGFVYRKDKFFTTALMDFMNLLDPHFTV